jgi:CBS-domain-containing membrane protein
VEGKGAAVLRYTSERVTVMETVLLRILLLIVLFILLTGDYTELFNQILQQGPKSTQASRDATRTKSKSYPADDDDDADVTQMDDSLDIDCEFLQILHHKYNNVFIYPNL